MVEQNMSRSAGSSAKYEGTLLAPLNTHSASQPNRCHLYSQVSAHTFMGQRQVSVSVSATQLVPYNGLHAMLRLELPQLERSVARRGQQHLVVLLARIVAEQRSVDLDELHLGDGLDVAAVCPKQ